MLYVAPAWRRTNIVARQTSQPRESYSDCSSLAAQHTVSGRGFDSLRSFDC